MPNPIPRNRSAGGRRPRRPARQRVWPTLPFRRPRVNIRQPGQPPPRPQPPARHRTTPGLPFRRPQENIRQPGPPPPRQRPPARHRATPGLPFRRLLENIRRPGPPLPTPTRSGTNVAVWVILCAVAALVVWIVLPVFPLGTSTGSTAAPPMSDTGAAAAGDGAPGPVGGQLAAPPGVSAGLDHDPTPEGGTRDDGTEGHRAVGFPVAPVAKRQPVPAAPPPSAQPPAAQPSPAAQPARPSEPADVADPGPSVDPPTVDQPQRRPVLPSKPNLPKEPVPPREPQTPPGEPRVPSSAELEQLRDRLGSLADQLAQRAKDRGGDAGIGQPPPSPQARPDPNPPKVDVRPPAGKIPPPKQAGQKQSAAGSQKNVNPPSGSQGASPRSGPSG